MEEKTTALATVKQEVRLQEWSAQIEAQQAILEVCTVLDDLIYRVFQLRFSSRGKCI